MMTKRRKPRRAEIKKKSLKKLTCTMTHQNPNIFRCRAGAATVRDTRTL